MIQRQQLLVLPVKVISEPGYLLVKLPEGVAYDFPKPSGSTSNWQRTNIMSPATLPA